QRIPAACKIVCTGIHTRGPITRQIPASRLGLIEIRALAQSLLDVARWTCCSRSWTTWFALRSPSSWWPRPCSSAASSTDLLGPPRAPVYAQIMVRRVLSALLASTVIAGCATTGRSFPNATPGKPLTVTAWEERPEGPGPVPAVVLMHGCHGVSGSNHERSPRLRGHGYGAPPLARSGPPPSAQTP